MTEKELYKIILQKYSEETADFLAKEIREHFKDNDWDNYCNAVIVEVRLFEPSCHF